WQYTGGNLQYCFNSTCATATTLAAGTWAEVEIHVNSTSNITFISNIGGVTTSDTTSSAFTTTGLQPFLTCYATSAAARTCYVDFIQWYGITTSGDTIRD
ncbi:MAG TPA: hypothetical protein VFS31_07705, partial [Chitinophagaceae bacterium]|nr:hypothetical protein [Chitinophagaceae bacterium]